MRTDGRPDRLALLCLVVLLSACGGGGGGDGGGGLPPNDALSGTGGANASGEAAGTDGNGESGANFVLRVGDAVRTNTTDRWQAYIERQLQSFLAPLNELPGLLERPMTVNYDECGFSNAFYNPATRDITICDEIVDDLIVYWEQLDFAVLTVGFILYHEIGHALDDVRDVPITGNTESAADSIGAVVSARTGRAFAAVLGGDFLSRAPASYADEHTNGEDRAGDIMCWAIGSDSALQFNSTLAPLTTQFIEANRDCVREYADQQESIFQLVPELAGLQPTAAFLPSAITPDDPNPPKSVGGGSPEPSTGVLALLQNQTDATVGRDFWLCTSSQREFPTAYLFIGDRGINVFLTGEEDALSFDFVVTGVGDAAIELTYQDIDEVETITDIVFSGTTMFSAISSTDGRLSCERTALAAGKRL